MMFRRRKNEEDAPYFGDDLFGEDSDPYQHSGITEYCVRVSIATDIGHERGNNEDNFYVEGVKLNKIFQNSFSATYTTDQEDNLTFALFDGIGGTLYGEEASALAANIMEKYGSRLRKVDGTRQLDNLMREYVSEANRAVTDLLDERQCASGGTTMTVLHLMGDVARVYYLGDTRLYSFHDGTLTQLTRDHTVASQKIHAKIYTPEEAKGSPDLRRLTLFLGKDRTKNWNNLHADILPSIPLEIGSKFLICTDGLTTMCSDEEITEILDRNYYNESAALVRRACDNGGKDNVTCITVQILPPSVKRSE